MTLFLLALGLLSQADDQAIRDQVDIAIREEFGTQETRKLAKMPGAGAVIMKMIREGDVRVCALIGLLGRLRVKEAEGYLLSTLKNDDPCLRVAAAIALAQLKCLKATDGIVALLNDPAINDSDKASVAWALGELGDEKALEAVKAYKNDLVRRNVKLGTPNLQTNHAIVKLDAIATQDPIQREKKLSDLLVTRHENAEGRELRMWAAGKLADYQYSKAIPLIRAILPDLEGQEEVRAQALEAVKRLGGKLTEQELDALRKNDSN